MFATGTLSAAWVGMILDAFESIGLDEDAICSAADLERSILQNPDARIPIDAVGVLWRLALHRSADPLLGLHAGERVVWRANHLLPLLLFTAPTIGEGVESFVRYQQTYAHARIFSLQGKPGHRRLRHRRADSALPTLDQTIEFVAVACHRLIQTAAAKPVRLQRVTFEHQPLGNVEEYERVFGCPVAFGCQYQDLFLDEVLWTMPSRDPSPLLQAQLSLIAADTLRSHIRDGYAGLVSNAVRGALLTGDCTVEQAASAMGVTVRTLQRRLTEESTSYREVLEETRRTVLMLCLDRGCSTVDTLRLAGFPNVRSLHRAMRRWNLDLRLSQSREHSDSRHHPDHDKNAPQSANT